MQPHFLPTIDFSSKTVAAVTAVFLVLLFLIQNVATFKRSTGTKSTPLAFFLSLLMYVVALPGGIVTLFVFAIYSELVSLILRLRYGSKFGGLVQGANAIHTVEKGMKSVINVLMICEYDESHYGQSIYETARESIYNFYFRDPERFPLFLSNFRAFMGYAYVVKNQVTLDDCVKTMKNVNSKNGALKRDELLELVEQHCNQPLPKNETVLWEVLVGTQPVNWNPKVQKKGVNSYPVVFRIHHGIADGVSLIKLMVGAFADNANIRIVTPEAWKMEMRSQEAEELSTKGLKGSAENDLSKMILNLYKQMRSTLELILTSLYVLCLAPTTLFVQSMLKAKDRNTLHGPSLSGEIGLSLNTEISPQYVEKIKRIKDRFPGTAFPEVLLTAFSASLDDYFQKNSNSSPEYVTAIIPVTTGSSALKNLTVGKDEVEVNLNNKFSLLLLKLPLRVKPEGDFVESTSIVRRLKLLQKETNALKNSVDYVVNYWVISVALALFPHPFIRLFMKITRCTTLMSILPGPPKVTFCGGCPVHDVIFWVPHRGFTGIGFSALTYDGRLQMGLNVDKALISDKKDAQSIVDGVYRYLDLLEAETS